MSAQVGNLLKSLALTLGALLVSNGAILYQSTAPLPFIVQALFVAMTFLMGAIFSKSPRVSWCPEGIALGLLIFFSTPSQFQTSPFFQWWKGWQVVVLGLVPAYFLAQLLSKGERRVTALGVFTAITAAGMGVAAVLSVSGGYPLFSDDHPAFLYRLLQLKEHFPSIPFYNPGWNGGVEAREFFPSGALGLFLLWSPLIYLSDLWSSYNVIVLGTIFGVAPALFALATYLQFSSYSATAFAAIFGVSCSTIWYRWGLSYGTLPFLLSVSALPLAFACIEQMILQREKISFSLAVTFIFSASLTVFWSLGALLLAPTLFFCSVLIFLSKEHQPRKKKQYLLCLTLLAALHLPWMILFATASKIFAFLSPQTSPSFSGVNTSLNTHAAAVTKKVVKSTFLSPHIQRHGIVSGSIHLAQEFLRATNPLLIVLFLPALSTTIQGGYRLRYLGVTLLAILLAILGPVLVPQLELQRFWLFATALAVPSISATIARLLHPHTIGSLTVASTLARAVFLLFLLLTPSLTWRTGRQATSERFTFANQEVFELAEAIDRHSSGGRALFAGFVLHEFHGGHIAPLESLTQTPLIASSYQHDKWRYTDVIPADFLARKTKGIDQYLDLMNVSLVIAHSSDWKKWYRARKKKFQEVAIVGRWVLFTRRDYLPSYLASGDGDVQFVNGNTLLVTPKSQELVLKFQYLPLLTTSGCLLSPEKVGVTLSLISLKNCPLGAPVEVKMRGPVKRIVDAFSIMRHPNGVSN